MQTELAIATEVLAALDGQGQIAPFTGRVPGFGLPAAYRAAAALRRLREARGERPAGRKLGFTNRNIWPEFGISAPIWGDMYDTTVRDLAAEGDIFDLGRLSEPKIEPEIAFGLARAPEPGMDEMALMGCIGWVAHGIEMVQSVYPGWRFRAPDTVAGAGMHAACLLGPRHPVAPGEADRWRAALAGFTMTLRRNGEVMDTGHAGAVLGGPLTALRHFVAGLAAAPEAPPLAAGEIVTTGTITRALDVAPGETWQTVVEGLPLPGLRLTLR